MAEHVKTSRLAWDKARTRELFERYKADGDPAAREELIVNNMNLVRFIANKFSNRGEPIEDLIQVGSIGLIKAIDRFEPERGLEFTTFATPTIMGEIKRHFRDKGWSVRVPRRLQELNAKVSAATELLTVELQHTPSVHEIADYLQVSVDEVLEAMESSGAYSALSLDAATSDDEDSYSLLDRIPDEEPDYQGFDDRMFLNQVMADLPRKEREILMMRFVQEMTQAQIAEKLGVSQVQVSRIIKRTLSKIQQRAGANIQGDNA